MTPPSWWRILVYTHRWLGIAGCLLFVSWFASGIVMMYARMPGLAAGESALRLEPLDLSRANVSVAEAAKHIPGGRDSSSRDHRLK